MNASTKRILSIAVSGALLIGAVIVYSSFIRPELDVIGRERGTLTAKVRAFSGHKEAVGRVQDLIAQMRGIEKLREVVGQVLPEEPRVRDVLHQLDVIARKNQVTLTAFSVTPLPFEDKNERLARRLGALEASVSVSGSYESLKGFLRDIETNVRVFDVQDFSISAQADRVGGTSDSLAASLSLRTYFQE